jgi:hypothetical protein
VTDVAADTVEPGIETLGIAQLLSAAVLPSSSPAQHRVTFHVHAQVAADVDAAAI